jgi:N-carbamoylputrescine amidase
MLKVALIQQSSSSDLNLNRIKLTENITKCASEGAELVVLQELHESRYFCQTEDILNFDLAETIPGVTSDYYAGLAQTLEIVLVTSLFEERAAGLYHNTAVIFEKDGSVAGTYRKMHIPDDPNFYEKFYFTPGDMGFRPIQTSVGKLGVLVCWDQWYPEAARLMALAGAQILIYPTAIGWTSNDGEDERKRQLDAWLTIQKSHAIANGIPVISVNRTGYEPDESSDKRGIEFWGHSFVAGPQGEIISMAPESEEANLIVEVDLNMTDSVRRWWPFLRDRRIDAYEDLTKRYID